MNKKMGLQMSFCYKAFIATLIIAMKWPIIGMSPHMCF